METRLILLSMLCAAIPLAAQERTIPLSNVGTPVMTAHVNGKPAPLPDGAKASVGKDGIRMDYVFASAGHDACMVEFPVDQGPFSALTVELSVSGPGHRPFVVLTDKNGEKHYFSLVNTRNIAAQALKKAGKHTLSIPVPVRNEHPGEKFAFRWGGDDNQTIDFPVQSVRLGLNDSPDEFQGTGWIVFHSISFR